jgi:hypothetical protein
LLIARLLVVQLRHLATFVAAADGRVIKTLDGSGPKSERHQDRAVESF